MTKKHGPVWAVPVWDVRSEGVSSVLTAKRDVAMVQVQHLLDAKPSRDVALYYSEYCGQCQKRASGLFWKTYKGSYPSNRCPTCKGTGEVYPETLISTYGND